MRLILAAPFVVALLTAPMTAQGDRGARSVPRAAPARPAPRPAMRSAPRPSPVRSAPRDASPIRSVPRTIQRDAGPARSPSPRAISPRSTPQTRTYRPSPSVDLPRTRADVRSLPRLGTIDRSTAVPRLPSSTRIQGGDRGSTRSHARDPGASRFDTPLAPRVIGGGDAGGTRGGAVRIETRSRDALQDARPYQSRRRISVGGDDTIGRRSALPRTDGSRSRSTLSDLYSRVPSTNRNRGDAVVRTRGSELYRDSLAHRYRERLQSDLQRARDGAGATVRDRRADRSGADSLRPRVRPPGADSAGSPRQPAGAADARRGADRPRAGGLRPRGPRDTASHRYAPPGSVRADAGSRRGDGDTRFTALTPVPHRGETLAERGTPTLTPISRRGPVLADRRPAWRTPVPVGSYVPARSHYYGSVGWTGSRWCLSFGLGYAPYNCTWGLYSYPYYYCGWWPRWYSCYRSSFSFYWNSCYPWYGGSWWWPTTYYSPAAYVSHYYSFYDLDDYGPYTTPAYPSGVVIHEGETDDAAEDAAPSSLRALAEQHVALGDFYFKEERFKEAAESYLRALAYAPDDATIHFVLADALFATGDYHYAAYMIVKALELEPELARADADKRTFYSNPETFEKQLKTLEDYVADKTYDAAAFLVLGYNLKFSGRSAEAKHAFARVLEIDPGHEAAALFSEALDAPKEGPSIEAEPSKKG